LIRRVCPLRLMLYALGMSSSKGGLALAMAIVLAGVLATGCSLDLGGELASDVTTDTGGGDSASDSVAPDGDAEVPDAPDGDEDTAVDPPVDPAPDVPPDTSPDTSPDPVDVPPDTVPDPAPDIVDVETEPGECTTMWDPACDDGNECTTDWCDLATETCVHSGASAEGTSCTYDGNECTSDLCTGGVCVHQPAREGEFCADDGEFCTTDLCESGVCVHPGGPMDGVGCTDDSDLCTADECDAGVCTHDWISGCCYRDGDCLWLDHLWECDVATNVCYDPPHGHFCDSCTTREDCGDGGSASDDYCVWWDTISGCATDCADDLDCPRGASCINLSETPCTPTDTECICVPRVGECRTWRNFGESCSGDGDCGGADNYCFGSYCTWDCTTDDECPWESTGCVMGTCRM